MKLWMRAPLKLIWASYLLLTSLYCLLAFLPYTYYALINAPAYRWMPWFVLHHAQIYWVALLGAAAAHWNQGHRRTFAVLLCALTVGGLFITARPFLPQLHANPAAYVWSEKTAHGQGAKKDGKCATMPLIPVGCDRAQERHPINLRMMKHKPGHPSVCGGVDQRVVGIGQESK